MTTGGSSRIDVDQGENGVGFAWLTVVAVREVWRDSERSHDLAMGALTLGDNQLGELPEPAASTQPGVDELAAAHLEHAERVADLRAIKPNERTALYLQALGYRYREIGAATDAEPLPSPNLGR